MSGWGYTAANDSFELQENETVRETESVITPELTLAQLPKQKRRRRGQQTHRVPVLFNELTVK